MFLSEIPCLRAQSAARTFREAALRLSGTVFNRKLFKLGDGVTVHAGHGPTTTIGQEKRHNPFVGENASFMG